MDVVWAHLYSEKWGRGWSERMPGCVLLTRAVERRGHGGSSHFLENWVHTHRGCCVEWRWITTAEPHEGNEGLSTAGPWIYDQHVQALSKQSPDGHGNNGSRKVTQRTIRQMQTQMRWRINNKIEEKCMDLGLSSFNIQVTLESGAATRRHGRWRRSSLV